MKLVMTMMVRDEADIISAMIEYHLDQGVDQMIVTDNGSQDGTLEILQSFAARGSIDLRHDPVHRKQQSSVVTKMARDAYTLYGADWVINADADEFFVPLDRTRSLHNIFDLMPKSIQSFLVPVVNLTGSPALQGSGLQRLTYRDQRSQQSLEDVGIRAHPTPDAIHVGDPDVSVIQGNHLVSLASHGSPDPELGLEVLHLPWRSWKQYKYKVEVAGRAYKDNVELTPSPNHHGMRDYARLKVGALLPFYLMRHPSQEDFEAGAENGQLIFDDFLARRLESPVADVSFDDEIIEAQAAFMSAEDADRRARTARAIKPFVAAIDSLNAEFSDLRELYTREAKSHQKESAELRRELDAFQRRRVVRAADAVGQLISRFRTS